MVEIKDEGEKSGLANHKLITTTTGTVRVSQACDRCRIKKIKCDGQTPCHNCSKIGFDCKTSDKLTRRAFPKGYTENLEQKVKEMEKELELLKQKYESGNGNGNSNPVADYGSQNISQYNTPISGSAINTPHNFLPHSDQSLPQNIHGRNIHSSQPGGAKHPYESITLNNNSTQTSVQINNPIDQIFNLDTKGVIIGNDNLNFESQFNHLLINLNLPFLKITNSHNFLLNDPNSYLYHPSYYNYNQFHNRDLNVIYNPLTAIDSKHDGLMGEMTLSNNQLPTDIYDLFIKLINNFKKMFRSKKELDSQIIQFFLNYNILIPIFDFKEFMESYVAFHTMYPFMFTYNDATINGFNISNNDYKVVNEYFMVIVQIYAMIMMNDPTLNLNLLLNHSEPRYIISQKSESSVIRSVYDFLPYFNVFHVSVGQLQTHLLFLYYSLITNNKEKSLVLLSMINSFIGILGINLNSKNLFFNDLTLSRSQKRTRVKNFWVFKVLLKVFNLKFGFKPSINTTVINPVTIDRYFELTPEKLSLLLDDAQDDELFRVLLKPSIEFLNLMNIVIPSSFSPNYYQYLKGRNHNEKKKSYPKLLDGILNDDDGDGNDGNLNYNFTQFQHIDDNLTGWRLSLKSKEMDLHAIQRHMNLPVLSNIATNNLYHTNLQEGMAEISTRAMESYKNTGLPDVFTASELIKIQLNFHYLLIRSMNYLNFIIDRELSGSYYKKIQEISKEVLSYFLSIFRHVADSTIVEDSTKINAMGVEAPNNVVLESLGLDVDEDGFVINDFLAKRRKTIPQKTKFGYPGQSYGRTMHSTYKNIAFELASSPYNRVLNGLSLTIINFKKSMVMQMLYLLICCLRIYKKGGAVPKDIRDLLNESVDLFIKIYINYDPQFKQRLGDSKKVDKENRLYNKLINDELEDEILREPRRSAGAQDSDSEDSDGELDEDTETAQTDWDDEDLDEDLKYLKILKFIKYKINSIYASSPRNKSASVRPDHRNSKSGPLSMRTETQEVATGPRLAATSTIGPTIGPVISNQTSPQQSVQFKAPSLTGLSSMYSGSAGFPSPQHIGDLSKMPSLTKLDMLLDDSYQMVMADPSNPYTVSNKAKEMGPMPKIVESDLVKKERLAVSDLMSLKNQPPVRSSGGVVASHRGGPQQSPNSMYQNSWNYDEGQKKST